MLGNNRKEILHIMGAADVGGIGNIVLQYYKLLDKEKYHFDIALHSKEKGMTEKELENMGCTIYHLSRKTDSMKDFSSELGRILDQKTYDAIHVHQNETSYIALRVAKKKGVKCRIAHSHTTSSARNLRSFLYRISGIVLNPIFATKLVGCGVLAGDRVFGKRSRNSSKRIDLPNAIEVNKYRFNDEIRKEVRKELNIEGKYVIGMIGRFSEEKNHKFAIKVFEKITTQNDNVILALVGTGEEEEAIRIRVKNGNLQDRVVFLGVRNDVEKLYQGFDLLIMPSRSEGFPLSAIEAITSGLPVILSDAITKEFDCFQKAYYERLNVYDWLRRINSVFDCQSSENRKDAYLTVKKEGYDISDTVHILEEIYR